MWQKLQKHRQAVVDFRSVKLGQTRPYCASTAITQDSIGIDKQASKQASPQVPCNRSSPTRSSDHSGLNSLMPCNEKSANMHPWTSWNVLIPEIASLEALQAVTLMLDAGKTGSEQLTRHRNLSVPAIVSASSCRPSQESECLRSCCVSASGLQKRFPLVYLT